MPALRYMIEDDEQEQVYRDYTATMQMHLVQIVFALGGGKDWEPPSFIDLAHPYLKKQEKPQQSAEDAKQHVYALFGIEQEPQEGR